MALTKYKLGELIEQRREKYDGISNLPIRGVSREGFINAKQPDADKSLYNTFYKYDFVFNPARMEINSIALNIEYEKAICSSLYEIFFIKDKNIILPEYLNLFIKRDEFARLCEFIGWGSAREYCRVGDISDVEISLPPLSVQQKYVNIYNAMLENQRCYERGLEDLKLVCDAYIEDLRKKIPIQEIKSFISEVNVRNTDLNIDFVQGVNSSGNFGDTKADMNGIDLRNYKVVKKGQFAYNPSRINLGSIALLKNENCIVSPMYVVFEIADTTKLMPEYLMMWYGRKEFQRSTLFFATGSVRDTFSFDIMQEVKIPIPDIKIQKAIADIYNVYIERKKINEKLKEQIKKICPVLIKGSLEEGE